VSCFTNFLAGVLTTFKATIFIHIFGTFAYALRVEKRCFAAPRSSLYLDTASIESRMSLKTNDVDGGKSRGDELPSLQKLLSPATQAHQANVKSASNFNPHSKPITMAFC
jgi:hypothetical protein